MRHLLRGGIQKLYSDVDPCLLAVAGLLVLATMLAILSLAFRGYFSGRETYFFLFKDLFLAWVPMGLSLALVRLARRRSRTVSRVVLLAGLIAAWVLFLPNAPYLLTEVLHLNSHHAPQNMRVIPGLALIRLPSTGHVPLWYDAFMILLFAWNGLLLGVLSLRMVQAIVRERFGAPLGWAGAMMLLLLSAFGVTLGRFERFNSWDILSRPGTLLADVASRVLRPLAHPHTTGATLLLSAFLFLTYLTMVAMMNARRDTARTCHENRQS
jgi:uncharacterized membrane protein